eukprot:g4884.t1
MLCYGTAESRIRMTTSFLTLSILLIFSGSSIITGEVNIKENRLKRTPHRGTVHPSPSPWPPIKTSENLYPETITMAKDQFDILKKEAETGLLSILSRTLNDQEVKKPFATSKAVATFAFLERWKQLNPVARVLLVSLITLFCISATNLVSAYTVLFQYARNKVSGIDNKRNTDIYNMTPSKLTDDQSRCLQSLFAERKKKREVSHKK